MSESSSLGRVVAFGGGHGLFATLRAARALLDAAAITDLTAIVGVCDDGGSSGRIRKAFDVAPPGDLRMAIAALLPNNTLGEGIESILQYRFPSGNSESGLEGHVVGNVLLTALWNGGASTHEGLDFLGSLLGVQGRVLPCSAEAIDIVAQIVGRDPLDPTRSSEVSGQVAIATTRGRVAKIWIEPTDPQACQEAVEAIDQAEILVFGPGSWFTSVVPSLLVPGIRRAVARSSARRILIMNLSEQIGETTGFTPADYVMSWRALFSDIALDAIIFDLDQTQGQGQCEQAAQSVGAKAFRIKVASSAETHDPDKLADALRFVAQDLGSK